jgi:hypothetical protein
MRIKFMGEPTLQDLENPGVVSSDRTILQVVNRLLSTVAMFGGCLAVCHLFSLMH